MGEKRLWLSPILTGVVLCFYAFLMSLVGAMNPEIVSTYLFVSVLLTQTLMLGRLASDCGARFLWRRELLYAIALWIPVLLGGILSFFFSPIGQILQMTSFSLLGMLSLPLCPLLYLLWMYLIPKMGKRTGRI